MSIVCVGDIGVRLRTFSGSPAERILKEEGRQCLCLGNLRESDARSVWTVEYSHPPCSEPVFRVMILPHLEELDLVVFFDRRSERLVLGFDTNLVGVSQIGMTVEFEHDIGVPIRSVMETADLGFLVFHEIGVALFDFDWTPVWDFARDIVESYSLENGVLTMKFMDESPVCLQLKDGQPTSLG